VRLLLLRQQIAISKVGDLINIKKSDMAVVRPVESRILILRGYKVFSIRTGGNWRNWSGC
jgi:hypothetical protein